MTEGGAEDDLVGAVEAPWTGPGWWNEAGHEEDDEKLLCVDELEGRSRQWVGDGGKVRPEVGPQLKTLESARAESGAAHAAPPDQDSDTELVADDGNDGEEDLGGGDWLYHFAVYQSDRPVKQQELLLRSSQTLDDLRRATACRRSRLPNHAIDTPSFFFIFDTFFNLPGPSPHSAPLSQPIADRLSSLPAPHPLHTQPNAGDRPLHSVGLRRGAPFVIVHGAQAACEHIVLLRDARGVDPPRDGRPITPQPFPRELYRQTFRRRKCEVCSTCFATRIVSNDKNAPESPTLFCDDCFQKLHYDARGSLRDSSLRVFPLEPTTSDTSHPSAPASSP